MIEDFQRARLIPVSGISSDAEAEQRATSAFLAVLSIVRPFSKGILSPMGASRADRASVETFIEPPFKAADGKTLRPDGLIRVTYGSKTAFTALVEVKTGSSKLDADQVNSYWEIARAQSFDAVLTISNEISPSPGVHPTEGLKQRANSTVRVHHWSWTRILTEAVMHKVHRGVDDPEQAWILAELIRYLEHPASGAMNFDDMGSNWTSVRDGARNGTLRASDDAVKDIANRWDQLLGFVALSLGADIGSDVQEITPRAHQRDPALRSKYFVDLLCSEARVDGTLRIPDSAGDLDIDVDLKARQISLSVNVDAPGDKKLRGQLTWLLRQLQQAPPTTIVEASVKNARQPVTATLGQLRDDTATLIEAIGKREVNRFCILSRSDLGMNRKAGRKPGFVQSVTTSVEAFYGAVLQDLVAYQRRAPRLSPRAEPARDPVVDRPEPTQIAGEAHHPPAGSPRHDDDVVPGANGLADGPVIHNAHDDSPGTVVSPQGDLV